MTGFELTDERCDECGCRIWRPSGCSRYDCPTGQRNRAREKATAARRAKVRNPPRLPFNRAGVCRLCGADVVAPRRSWCSQACVDIWWMATSSDRARRDLVAFYPGCWECGELESFDVGVQVDHVVPLWNLTVAERLELKWWLPFNLQLLCDRCHAVKTKREAGRRAEIRRTGR